MALDFLKRILRPGTKRREELASRRRPPFRPRLDPLEDRSVPATFTWTGAVSQFWSNPANWAENRVPESGPDADLDRNDEIYLTENSFNDIPSKGTSVHAAKIVVGFSPDGFHGGGIISGGPVRLDSSTGPSVFESYGTIEWGANLELVGSTEFFLGGVGFNRTQITGIVSGSGGLIVAGDLTENASHYTFNLAAHNTYAGGTIVENVTLEVREEDALGATTQGTRVDNDATLILLSSAAGGQEPLRLEGRLSTGTGGVTSWSGPVIFESATSHVFVDGVDSMLTLSGPLSGPSHLHKTGLGTLVLAGTVANTYSGRTEVREGRLDLNMTAGVHAVNESVFVGIEEDGDRVSVSSEVRLLNDNQIPNTAGVVIGNGSLNLNGRSDTIGDLTLRGGRVTTGTVAAPGVGMLTLNGSVIATSVDTSGKEIGAARIEGKLALGNATRTLTVEDGPAGNDMTIAAAISGTGGLTMTGSGRLRLSGNNSYTGVTTVVAGQLVVDGNQPSSPVDVRSGAVLLGSGTIGPLNVRFNGDVSPGNGDLTVTGNATFGGIKSRFLPFVSSAGSNALGVTGTLDLNDATLSLLDVNVPGALPPLGVPVPIVGAASVVGRFVNLPQNAIAVSASGIPYRVTYTPNQVLVTRLAGPAFVDRAITPIIDEGGVATLTGRITTTEPNDKFFLEVNWGDGTRTKVHKVNPGEPRDVALKHRYKDDGTYTVSLLWRDQRGAFNTGTLEITVRNVAPAVFVGGNLTLGPGGLLTRHGCAFDPGPRDRLTATVNYGDGSGEQPLELDGNGHFKLRHRYETPGIYTVVVTVYDDEGGVGTDRFRVTVLECDEDD